MKKNKFITLLFVSVLLVSGCQNPETSNSNNSSASQDNPSSDVTSDASDVSSEPSTSITSETPTSEEPVTSETPSTSEVPPSSEAPNSEPKNPYYTSISDMAIGSTLQTSLKTLITSTHKTETTYDRLSSVFSKSDADPKKSGNVIWFYSGTSVKFSGFGGSNGATNREHVWPKDGGKAFPEKSKAGSDAHHLRPTETQLNSIRGSKSFGVVEQSSGNIAKQNGSTNYASGDYLSYTNSTYFYPGKGYRGQTARILFYVHVRWGQEYNLRFVLGSGSSKTIGDIETLMKWHLEEPVVESEMIRNEEVFKIQGNRNPFIDEPQYACKIYANDGQSYSSTVANVCANY